MRRWIFFLMFCFTIIGCAATKQALDNYEACKGDQACVTEMEQVRASSYVVAKTATNSLPLPSLGEGIAIVVSNLIAFGFGVLKGKKKG